MHSFKYVKLCVTDADASGVISKLAIKGYLIKDIQYIDEFTVSFWIQSKYANMIIKELSQSGAEVFETEQRRKDWFLNLLRNRVFLLIGMATILLLTIWIPTRVLFFEVHGCSASSYHKIIDQLSVCGLPFGTQTKIIDSNAIKNAMLETNNMLEWVGITVRGCVAQIEVKEQQNEASDLNFHNTLSHIVAREAGIIDSVTAENGTALCRPGQAVYKGQILISGYEDCGRHIRITNARGEVSAYTYRNLTAICPTEIDLRTEITSTKTNYLLEIGKKQINFSKDSGISQGSCVKMYLRKYVTLPGGYQLPLAIVTEECIYYDTESMAMPQSGFSWLEHYLEESTVSEMVAGEILSKNFTHDYAQTTYQIKAFFSCKEQIGVSRIEGQIK